MADEDLVAEMLGGIFRALVVHKMMTPPEFAGAELALEGLLALVDQHVRLELVGIGEARSAQLARVWPLAGVNAEVST